MESARNLLQAASVNGKSRPSLKNLYKEIPVVKIEDDMKTSHVSTHQSQLHNAIDFTADVTIEQLNDEEVMEHLSEIENISFDPDICGSESQENDADRSLLQSSQQRHEQNDKCLGETRDVILVEESSSDINKQSQMYSENQWYDELIKTKVSTVLERFSKLARVLKYSYPCYKNCLDRIEAKIGTPVCKLDPPHRCPLDRANINRWEFVCTRKSVMESADSKTEADKNVKNMWLLESCDGSNTITNKSLQMIPTFVMRAVKMFENFINSSDRITHPEIKVKDEIGDDDVVVLESDEKSSVSGGTSGTGSQSDVSPQWSWLLVRSNSKGELMMFATGKYIAHSVMESLKQLFEIGLGKSCNVKSLYCKAMTKINDVQTWNTTFLVGAEALDETVGNLKIQLAPKTNFWLSTSGAEELAKTVEEFLDPPDLGTVVDIGCGLGLIGLSIAHKCYQVIGIDSPSEVEEAEMTCELNKIKNAYFLMGEPAEMMTTIEKAVEWRRALAIINANTTIGRTVEVMIGLRKIKNLRRIVLVTTLTKQSVRSILELTRPADEILGDPFVAIRAAVVDTLPTGSQFEVVILMERRPLPQMLNAVLSQVSPNLVINNSPARGVKNSPIKNTIMRYQKTLSKKSNFVKNTVALAYKRRVVSNKKLLSSEAKPEKRSVSGKRNENVKEISVKKFVKNPFYEQPFKATHMKKRQNPRKLPPSKSQNKINQHKTLSASRPHDHANQQNSPAISRPRVESRSPTKTTSNPTFHMKNMMNDESFGSLHDSQKRGLELDLGIATSNAFIPNKRIRENNDNINPGISAQMESDLLQKVKEQQHLLEVAKQKLTGSSSQVVDHYTAREVQDMLNLAIERTNQIESQIPRSVWNRIAPPEHSSPDIIIQKEIMFKGHHVHEINQEDIVITTSNKEFKQTFDAAWTYNRCSGVPPLEPNLVMPRDTYTNVISDIKDRKLQHQNNSVKQKEERWVPALCTRRPLTPLTHSMSSVPKKILSPAKDDFQQQQAPIPLQGIVRPSRQFAPLQRSRSPMRQKVSAPPQELMHLRTSPPRRQVVSAGFGDEWDIPSRGASEQQTNWERVINNHQAKILINRWDIDAQQDKFHQGNNFNSNWKGNKPVDGNWANNSSGGGGDNRNRKQILANQTANKQWPSQQQQIPTGNRFGRSSGSDWTVRGREVANTNNTRDDAWLNANKRRWSEPQSNENLWNRSGDMEDWNDLPEDARDPWGDESGSCGPSQGNWNRNPGANERSMAEDSWRSSERHTMNSRPQWQANMSCSNLNPNMNFANLNMSKATANMNMPNPNMNNINPNMNNARWSGGGVRNDNMKIPQQTVNWQRGKGNNGSSNGWSQQCSFGGSQPPRSYN